MHIEILQREQKSHFYIESSVISGAVGGKTGKTSVLLGFSKIVAAACHTVMVVLPSLERARCAGGAAGYCGMTYIGQN